MSSSAVDMLGEIDSLNLSGYEDLKITSVLSFRSTLHISGEKDTAIQFITSLIWKCFCWYKKRLQEACQIAHSMRSKARKLCLLCLLAVVGSTQNTHLLTWSPGYHRISLIK